VRMPYLGKTAAGIRLKIRATPKASKSQIMGLHGTPPRLRIRIAAPPVDGAANEELLNFLRKVLQVSKSQLSLEKGEASKDKEVLCQGLSEEECRKRLTEHFPKT
jgi:uncharacterized protein (TIGR00251 family)